MSLAKNIIAGLLAASLMGCAGAGQKTGEFVDDSAITAKVKTGLFNDPVTSGWNISVITKDGVVMLAGTVKSAREKDRAQEIARGVAGVKSVRNNLVTK
jgi:osmotically-inducible protein OsmY